MAILGNTIGKFWQSLAAHLPVGFAWPRDPSSVQMRWVKALADCFEELHNFTRLTANQWQPHQTIQRLAEWEDATGLPDSCFGANQTIDQRRKALLTRLRGPELAYTDTSPASPGALVGIIKALGYSTATVAYNTPFRAGMRCGKRLGQLDGKLWVIVTLVESQPFRVGMRCGTRLRLGSLNGQGLACYMNRVAPARYEVNLLLKDS